MRALRDLSHVIRECSWFLSKKWPNRQHRLLNRSSLTLAVFVFLSGSSVWKQHVAMFQKQQSFCQQTSILQTTHSAHNKYTSTHGRTHVIRVCARLHREAFSSCFLLSECPWMIRSDISEGHQKCLQPVQPLRIDNDMKTLGRLMVCEGTVMYKILIVTCTKDPCVISEYWSLTAAADLNLACDPFWDARQISGINHEDNVEPLQPEWDDQRSQPGGFALIYQHINTLMTVADECEGGVSG